MVHYGMVINLERCVRCHACTVACKKENQTPKGVSWHRILDSEYGKFPNSTRSFLPMPCMHCETAPCLEVCPTGATYRRPDGIVLVDYAKCIGCKYCMQACPYGARHFIDAIRGYYASGVTDWEGEGYAQHQVGVVEKCTFCVHRIDAGVKAGLTPGVDREATPACVITCPTEARIFGDLDHENSDVSKLVAKASRVKEHLGTKPSVYYVGFKGEM
jgi:phenylacetyl-CoA:acceptor oxidoreductase subunit 1